MQGSIAVQDRNWAMAAHLSALVAAGLPFGHILGPLIVYLAKGHESEFVGDHARASLNYQITISLLAIIAILVGVAFSLAFAVNSTSESTGTTYAISFAVLWIALATAALVVLLASIIFIIMGTIAASEGRPYSYPFAIRFLR